MKSVYRFGGMPGLPETVTAYTLRHSVITDLISLHDLDINTVAIISGTSARMIEQHYGHLIRDRAVSALAKLR
jgi:integrase